MATQLPFLSTSSSMATPLAPMAELAELSAASTTLETRGDAYPVEIQATEDQQKTKEDQQKTESYYVYFHGAGAVSSGTQAKEETVEAHTIEIRAVAQGMAHRALMVLLLGPAVGRAVLLVLLLGAWYLTPAVLQASCSQDTMEGRSRGSAVDGHLCPDDGVLQEGRDHVVCVYPDRVVKVVRSCSSSSGVAQRRPYPRGPEHPSPNLTLRHTLTSTFTLTHHLTFTRAAADPRRPPALPLRGMEREAHGGNVRSPGDPTRALRSRGEAVVVPELEGSALAQTE